MFAVSITVIIIVIMVIIKFYFEKLCWRKFLLIREIVGVF